MHSVHSRGRGPMRAPRNLPPIKSVSPPPVTPPPGFGNEERPETPRSLVSTNSRQATPTLPLTDRSSYGSPRRNGSPRRIPAIHSGRVLHEPGMPLLCKVRLKTLKETRDKLKEWLPLTSDRLDHMVEFRAVNEIIANTIKREREVCDRWDVLVADMEKTYEIIAHVWNYVIQHLQEPENKLLQTKFHTTVNKRFSVMLEPLQLNRRRQDGVGDMMLSAVQQTQKDMDSLSAELKQYKEFAVQVGQLTDSRADETYVHDIQVVYERLSGHIRDLEQEAENANNELKKVKESSQELLAQLQDMRNKSEELQSQVEYLQHMTLANAQLQVKNTELTEAIMEMKKDIAAGQNQMMEELRTMREENERRAQAERDNLLRVLQETMRKTSVAEPSSKNIASEMRGHTHYKRACSGTNGKK